MGIFKIKLKIKILCEKKDVDKVNDIIRENLGDVWRSSKSASAKGAFDYKNCMKLVVSCNDVVFDDPDVEYIDTLTITNFISELTKPFRKELDRKKIKYDYSADFTYKFEHVPIKEFFRKIKRTFIKNERKD